MPAVGAATFAALDARQGKPLRCWEQCADECVESATGDVIGSDLRLPWGALGLNAMANRIELDVRGLEAPEPLARVLEALDKLPFGDCVLLKIDCRPQPLFRILERNGYAYDERPGSDSLFEITIRKLESA